MRVSRIQAEENRNTVINVASRLFREYGFDGIGLKDLMAGAGMTQGAFYKQFESKEDLAIQASRRALTSAVERWSAAAASNPEDPLAAVMHFYLSMGHCAEKADGCPVVALGADASRQSPAVKAAFEAGIEEHVEMIASWLGEDGDIDGKAMGMLSTMVGAVLLARAVNDPKLSRNFLKSAADAVLLQSSNRQANIPS